MPRQLRTQADDEEPLSRAEADVAGITTTPEVVYADTDEDQNRDDQRDTHQRRRGRARLGAAAA